MSSDGRCFTPLHCIQCGRNNRKGDLMAKLTIRKFDDVLKSLLRQQAKRRSMEQEARDILRRVIQAQPTGTGFAQRIHQRFAGLKAQDLPIPKRRAARLSPAPKH
jgi:antitoxin FitA